MLRQGRYGNIEDNFDRFVLEFDFHSSSETEDNFDKFVSEFDFHSRRSNIEDNFDRLDSEFDFHSRRTEIEDNIDIFFAYLLLLFKKNFYS